MIGLFAQKGLLEVEERTLKVTPLLYMPEAPSESHKIGKAELVQAAHLELSTGLPGCGVSRWDW